jgi:O-antigen/teichoic acid export membrane protein
LILNIPLASLVQIFVGVIQAHKLIKYKFIVEQFIVPLLKVIGTVFIIYVISQGVLGVVYAILLSNLVGVVLLGFIVWQLYPLRGIRNEKPIPITRDMLHFSVPLLFMGLVNRANNQSETILLGALSTNDQVGIYYIGLKATVFIAMFLDALNVIFAPIIAELYTKKDQVQLASLYRTVTRWAFTLSLPVFLFLFIFSADILEIFGPGFARGVSVLRVLAIAQMVFILTGPSGWILTMTGYPHLNLVNTSLTLVLTVILDLFLIPQYGALGAAIGTAITITLVNILRLFEVNLILHIQPYSSNYYKPVMSGILAIAVSITAGVLFNGALLNVWSTVISGLILALSYFLVLCLDNADQEIVSAIRSRVGRIALSLQK